MVQGQKDGNNIIQCMFIEHVICAQYFGKQCESGKEVYSIYSYSQGTCSLGKLSERVSKVLNYIYPYAKPFSVGCMCSEGSIQGQFNFDLTLSFEIKESLWKVHLKSVSV